MFCDTQTAVVGCLRYSRGGKEVVEGHVCVCVEGLQREEGGDGEVIVCYAVL